MTRDERLAKLRQARNPMEGILSSIQMIKGEKGEKGDKGDDGETPVKGRDYFTNAEIQSIISYIQVNLTKGDKGDSIKGDRGETPVRFVDYWTKEDQQKIISDIIKQIKPAKDGVSPKVEDIVKMVLKEIKIPTNEGLVTKDELVKFLQRGGFRGGGDTVTAGAGVSISVNNNGQKVITATGSGGLTVLAATGTIDDSNVTFTFTSAPTLVNINGSFYSSTSTVGSVLVWTIVGLTVTLAFPVGTGGSIFGI